MSDHELIESETRAFRKALLFILVRLCYVIWECRPDRRAVGYSEVGLNHIQLAD